jgi:hypothetical protein
MLIDSFNAEVGAQLLPLASVQTQKLPIRREKSDRLVAKSADRVNPRCRR